MSFTIKHHNKENEMSNKKFMIGQRVIYQGVLCTICKPDNPSCGYDYWVSNPEKGYNHGVATSNLKPLPNGQL